MKKLLFVVLMLSVVNIYAAKEKWQLKAVKSSSALKPGKSWTYKILFLGPNGDTSSAMTAKVEILAEDTFLHTQPSEWRYNELTEPAKIVDNDTVFTATPPVQSKFEPFNLYIPANFRKRIDTLRIVRKPTAAELALKEIEAKKPLAVHPDEVIEAPSDTAKPDSTVKDAPVVIKSLKEWELDCGIINGELLTIRYMPELERKTVTTLMQPMPGCLEIRAERKKIKRDRTVKDLQAVFYYDEKFGFVRWEYLKSDGSKVIFDLEKVAGF